MHEYRPVHSSHSTAHEYTVHLVGPPSLQSMTQLHSETAPPFFQSSKF